MRNEEAIWDRFSVIYNRVIKKDTAAYKETIRRISALADPDDAVLEIATGTGLISLGLSDTVNQITAVDFSPKMIAAAKKSAEKLRIGNVSFEVQDAYNLEFEADSFDVVIISNTLHIMPNPEKALHEIKRVLKKSGKLIAPTFVHAASKKAALLSKIMSVTGFRAYHKWTEHDFYAFLDRNGFTVVDSAILKASFPMAYVVAEM